MNFNKLSFAVIVVGALMIAGAFIWWATNFEFRFDAIRCFIQKTDVCNFRRYDPIALYIGVGILSLGLILKYSMNGNKNNKLEHNNVAQHGNGGALPINNPFRPLLIIFAVVYLGLTISSFLFIIEVGDPAAFGFAYYLGVITEALTATFFILLFLNSRNN